MAVRADSGEAFKVWTPGAAARVVPFPPGCGRLSGGEGGCSPEKKSERVRGCERPCLVQRAALGDRGLLTAVDDFSSPEEVRGYPCGLGT